MKKKIYLTIFFALSVIWIALVFFRNNYHPGDLAKGNHGALLDASADFYGEETSGYANKPIFENQQVTPKIKDQTILPVPVPTLAPKDTDFVEGGSSLTYSLTYSRRSIAKNGRTLLTFQDRVDSIRESLDQKMLVSYGPPHGWQIHAIAEEECITIDHNLPKNEDLQLYWVGDRTLVGVSVIYEEEMRPHMEDCFAEDTRLFVYYVDTGESRDLDMSAIARDPGTFFRIDGVSPEGFIKLSLVNSDQYFMDDKIKDLGTFQISLK